jgi:lipoate---protein ligase
VPPSEIERHASGLVIHPWTTDEALIQATRGDGEPRVAAYQFPERQLVLGRGSRPELELDLAAVLADSLPVFRRRGGGCTVLLDPGNLIVSVVLPLPGIGETKRAFAAISDRLIDLLAGCGAPGLTQRGISDLALGDRKVGGSSIYREKGLLYYSTTLLLAPDLPGMERWLAHPPREPDYRAGRRHEDFVGEIPVTDPAACADILVREFRAAELMATLAAPKRS